MRGGLVQGVNRNSIGSAVSRLPQEDSTVACLTHSSSLITVGHGELVAWTRSQQSSVIWSLKVNSKRMDRILGLARGSGLGWRPQQTHVGCNLD